MIFNFQFSFSTIKALAAVNSILQVENLTKSFGDLVLFENISLGLSEGQRVGLIAKNGSGKTTLLNILSGKEGYDNGTIPSVVICVWVIWNKTRNIPKS